MGPMAAVGLIGENWPVYWGHTPTDAAHRFRAGSLLRGAGAPISRPVDIFPQEQVPSNSQLFGRVPVQPSA